MIKDKEYYINLLEEFKFLLIKYCKTDYQSPERVDLRTEINQTKGLVQKIIERTGTGKLMNISPPPILGGYIYNNVNPFNVIFDPPYGINIIRPIIDSIDEAIGIIKSSETFTLELPSHKKGSLNTKERNKKNVFIVHGHDNAAKEEIARFITKIGLNPIILHEQVNMGLTIIEKFEKYSETSYAVVIMTPDDVGDSIKRSDKLHQRARQNVIFELGYFFGKLGRKNVCALLKGDIERPSDSDGILYIALDNEGGWKLPLVKELKSSHLEFDSNKVFE